ncbi:MAG: FtsW/RodA/SpoVE family cell cycle protein [Erysipelotrichaceae bacterium]|nr:FtsW/RodA/SpoVE family cell cycle protein [Erysipelotrichaceae bacterium]
MNFKSIMKSKWWSLRMPAKYDKTIFFSMLFLCMFGTIMILSVNAKDAVSDSFAVYKTLIKQVVFFMGGYVAMVFITRFFSLTLAKKYSFALVVLVLILCTACLFLPNEYGIRAWIPINIGPFSLTIQPSEFLKLALIIYIGSYLGSLSSKINYSRNDVLLAPMVLLGTSAFIILKQDDFGAIMIIAVIVGIMCILTTHPVLKDFRNFIRTCIVICAFFSWLFMFSPLGVKLLTFFAGEEAYQVQRFAIAQNPFTDYLDTGWQVVSSLVAFHKGGWKGVGLGNSSYKYGYVPTALTDSILPIIVEELGIGGFLVIAVAYFLILWTLFRYAWKIQTVSARMILVGIATYFFLHFVLNIGGITGLIPITGVPLLFISYGGSSTLNAMLSLGVAQAIIVRFNRKEIV